MSCRITLWQTVVLRCSTPLLLKWMLKWSLAHPMNLLRLLLLLITMIVILTHILVIHNLHISNEYIMLEWYYGYIYIYREREREYVCILHTFIQCYYIMNMFSLPLLCLFMVWYVDSYMVCPMLYSNEYIYIYIYIYIYLLFCFGAGRHRHPCAHRQWDLTAVFLLSICVYLCVYIYIYIYI